jgi:hypothetical protein
VSDNNAVTRPGSLLVYEYRDYRCDGTISEIFLHIRVYLRHSSTWGKQWVSFQVNNYHRDSKIEIFFAQCTLDIKDITCISNVSIIKSVP